MGEVVKEPEKSVFRLRMLSGNEKEKDNRKCVFDSAVHLKNNIRKLNYTSKFFLTVFLDFVTKL